MKYCSNCGKEINEEADVCIGCGTFLKNKVNRPNINTTNQLALSGFIISMVSLIINLFGLIGLTGLILSIVGLIKSNQINEKGRGLAIAGIIVGAFSVLYGIIMTANFLSSF